MPPPGDDRQLAETVARIFARPLDRSRPLWELYLIHGLEGGRVALLTKVHHSVVDGVSGNEILTVLLDPSPEGREIEPPAGRPPRPGRTPGDLEMLGRGVAGLARAAAAGAALGADRRSPTSPSCPGANAFPGVPTLSRALTGARRALGGPQDPGILEVTTARPPRTCFNGPISAHRSFAFGSVSLDTVKAIKNEAGVKVNDVVVAVCAGAVREFLLERDELPDEPLVAMVPVSVRAEDEQGTFGNRISTMIVPIPTDVADPRAAARARARAAAQRQGAPRGAARRPAHRRLDLHPARGGGARRPHHRRDPGPHAAAAQPGRLERARARARRSTSPGARLEAHYPVSAVVDGVGLNMTVMSYLDHVDFGIVADRDQIPDVWPLLRAAQREVDRAGARGRPRPGSRPSPRGRRLAGEARDGPGCRRGAYRHRLLAAPGASAAATTRPRPRRSCASTTAGSRRRTSPSAASSTSTAPRSRTSTSPAGARPGTTKVRIYNPRFEAHGWQSTHTAVEIVTDDMPFLIDSVGDGAEPARLRRPPDHPPGHPACAATTTGSLRRGAARTAPTADGRGRRVGDPRRGRPPDRPGRARASSSGHLLRVIGEVRAAVEDWPEMRARALDVVAELEHGPAAARPPTRSPRRGRSSPGSRTTTSPSSATATTSSRGEGGELRLGVGRRTRGSASCARRGGDGELARLRQAAAARCARARSSRTCSTSPRPTRARPCTARRTSTTSASSASTPRAG